MTTRSPLTARALTKIYGAPNARPGTGPAPTVAMPPGAGAQPTPPPAIPGAAAVALAGVDVEITTGESVAIMGPSGSGKTTLLHCLAGILPPTSGQVIWNGRDLGSMSERERTALRRQDFGFVFQSGQLLPELPADENAALPLLLGGVPRHQAVAAAREWLGYLGLGGMEDRRPGELSGGQAQRVAIARALTCSPGVIFADEPTGALDQQTGQEVLRVLREATQQTGASLVVVTHDEQVAAWCSRTIRMRDGLIIPDGGAHPAAPGVPTVGQVPNVSVGA
jgi:putative ABC transport system ATP-binding protein